MLKIQTLAIAAVALLWTTVVVAATEVPFPFSPENTGFLSADVKARVYSQINARQHRFQASQAPGVYTTVNPGQSLRAKFSADGLSLAPGSGDWRLAMTLTGAGAPGAIRPLAGVAPTAEDNRLVFQYKSLAEWYLNGDKGLEHGVTIKNPPSSEADAMELWWTIKSTLSPKQRSDSGVTFYDGERAVLNYDKLVVTDANGKKLAAKMMVAPGTENKWKLGCNVDISDAIFPVTVDPIFTQVKKLLVPGGSAYQSLKIFGDMFAVGAPRGNAEGLPLQSGLVYVCERGQGGPNNWGLKETIEPPAAVYQGLFGNRVDLTDKYLVVSASGTDAGVVYAYDTSSWSYQILSPPMGGLLSFGETVAIDANRIVTMATTSTQSFICVYEKVSGGWNLSDLIPTPSGNDSIYVLGISGETIVAGVPLADTYKGAVFVFRKVSGLWEYTAKLVADRDCDHCANFGNAVAIQEDLIVVGAQGYDFVPSAGVGGAIYLYQRIPAVEGSWSEPLKITHPSSALNTFFGVSVAIDGSKMVVGAVADNEDRGAVHVFGGSPPDLNSWQYLGYATLVDDYSLGFAVDISGGTFLANGDQTGAPLYSKTVYVFESKLSKDNLGEDCVTSALQRGNPVNVGTGNNYERNEDVSFPSTGSSFKLVRSYNSQENEPGPFGIGTNHNFNLSVINASDLHVTIVRADGAHRGFSRPDTDTVRFSADTLNGDSWVELNSTTGGWTWYTAGGDTYQFTADGKLAEKVTPHTTFTLTHDAASTTITDQATGRAMVLHYDSSTGYITSITGPVTAAVPSGQWAGYNYVDDTNGYTHLNKVTYPDGTGKVYTYEDPNNVPANMSRKETGKVNSSTGDLEPSSVISTWLYDNTDRVTSNENIGGKGIDIDYVSSTEVNVTDVYGTVTTYNNTERNGVVLPETISDTGGCGSCSQSAVFFQYEDSPLRVTERHYANGRIDAFSDFDGVMPQTIISDQGGASQRTAQLTYHPTLDAPLTRETDSMVNTGATTRTTFDYDDDGNTTANENPTLLVHRKIESGFTMDGSGAVVPAEYETTFSYNAAGQVTGIDGPRAGADDAVIFEYYTNGDLHFIYEPGNRVTEYTQYDAAGYPLAMRDPNSVDYSFTYDGRGRLTSVTNVTVGGTTSYVYTNGEIDLVTLPNGVQLDYVYADLNENGNTVRRLDRIFDNSGNYIAFEYDAIGTGKVTRKTIHSSGGGTEFWTGFDYDGPTHPGKLFKALLPDADNDTTSDNPYYQFGYDAMGNLNSVTDPGARATGYVYDVFNQVKAENAPQSETTSYDYDTNGQLANVIDAENKTTTYVYDDFGRVVEVHSPDTLTTRYAYDTANGTVTKVDANGTNTIYHYDVSGRLILTDVGDAAENITMGYDDGEFGRYGKGRLTSMADASGSYAFYYNNQGLQRRTEATVGSQTYVTEYGYDFAGLPTTLTYPSGRQVTFVRDTSGNVTSIRAEVNSTDQAIVDSIAYKPFGPVTGLDFNDGSGGTALSVSRGYDQQYRMTTNMAGSVYNTEYHYYLDSNVKDILDHTSAAADRYFNYDDLGRLTGIGPVEDSPSTALTYDKVGNRRTRTEGGTTETYKYIADSNLLEYVEGDTLRYFSYDAAGNPTTISELEPTWGEDADLTGGAPVELASYTYNGFGQRIKKVAGGSTVIYHYDLAGNLIAETTDTGAMIAEYIYLGTEPVAVIAAIGGTEQVYYYINDHLGTPQAIVDQTGSVVWRANYDPFGTADISVALFDNNFRFAGQYYDQETGLHYNWHRYYDPSTGRYLTPDPIGLAGGINFYTYVQNNPINLIDLYGLRGGPHEPPIGGPRLDPGLGGGPSGGVPMGGLGDPTKNRIDQYRDFMSIVNQTVASSRSGEGVYLMLTKKERKIERLRQTIMAERKFYLNELSNCLQKNKCGERREECLKKYDRKYNKYIAPMNKVLHKLTND